MVYYKPVKVTINAPGLAEIIINIVVRYHDLPDSIVIDRGIAIYLKVLVIAMLFPRHQAKTPHRLLPLDKQADRKAE